MSLAKNIMAMLLVTGSLWGCSLSQEREGDGSETLAGSQWRVEAIGDQPVAEGSTVTIGFSEDGRVFGSSSCNRYNGGWHVQGGTLEFSQMAATRMVCPDPAMAQENRFLELLEDVHRYQLEADGRLVLETPEGVTITAVPKGSEAV
ncbi:META domain-containing protein [Marinobacter oulmenensis]|uniref:Heat shock protein HslJ n=1 Tax=Marinobacter oulmenensis TaxID=643747 RepID=A0A840UEY9_9GAMM|nr:META domain-containing protein [Marinobacter oulmenensis]MBB5319746.1 heat shock protein HslJ [Marinobacter oulmenensis]